MEKKIYRRKQIMMDGYVLSDRVYDKNGKYILLYDKDSDLIRVIIIDDYGNRISTTAGFYIKSVVNDIEFDDNGRIIGLTMYDHVNPRINEVKIQYNNGNVVHIDYAYDYSNIKMVDYKYNKNNMCICRLEYYVEGKREARTYYFYDEENRLIFEQYQSCSGDRIDNYNIAYDYDENGNCVSSILASFGTEIMYFYHYDEQNMLYKRTWCYSEKDKSKMLEMEEARYEYEYYEDWMLQ